MQEVIALSVVALAAGTTVWTVFRSLVADPLSRWLLTRGQVKWAMRVRRWVR